MVRPLPHRALLALLAGALLSGCAARPPEPPIVLRRPAVERRAPARKPAPPAPPPAATDPASPLTPEQKQSLFQDFDRYLARPSP